MASPSCNACGAARLEKLIDFGPIPIAHRFRTQSSGPEEFRHPMVLHLCDDCGLVQIIDDQMEKQGQFVPRSIQSQAPSPALQNSSGDCFLSVNADNEDGAIARHAELAISPAAFSLR
ncbi:MAG: hypothetical protein HY924_15690 [Elusimicrobia bacterium]|nr:hypothetical protein [Elusimicrobiota bacterium]